PRYDPDALPAHAAKYRDSLIIPDKILLYGKYWKTELEKNQFYTEQLVVVGSSQIDKYRKKRLAYLEQRNDEASCTILFTSQGIDRERLIEFLSHFFRMAQGKLNYEFYIKLHPGFEYDKQIYEIPLGKFPNVHILLGAEDPSTYELQAKADYHVSISSASHYDALGLGVPTIILPFATHEDVLHLVTAGHAKLVRTPEEFLDVLLDEPGKVPSDVSTYYFEPNALGNIKRVLENCNGTKEKALLLNGQASFELDGVQ
ncbi:MAG: hypothetical protein H8E29_08195, partial [Anaerolineales bacterium]|nr:hypothetical protein [Candidatus Desulfolinea nitratireducens]